MKKFTAILFAIAMISMFSLTAFAYDTDVIYEAHLDQEIDVDKDGTTDGSITDETPFLLMVPAELTADGDSDTVYIAGITDEDVTVTVPETAPMTDESSNELDVNIEMDGKTLVLPTSITEVGYADAEIKAAWIEKPLAGSWTGNFMYEVY